MYVNIFIIIVSKNICELFETTIGDNAIGNKTVKYKPHITP